MTDEEWVKRAVHGDEHAVIALYRKYVRPVYRFCYWQTGKHEDAEDLTQQTFIAMIHGLSGFRGQASFKNWLYSVAKNKLREWIRERYRLPQVPLLDHVSNSERWIDESQPEQKKQKAHTVEVMLRTLKTVQQRVLRLRYLRKYSVAETARELKLSESNVKIITKRALEALAKTFGE